MSLNGVITISQALSWRKTLVERHSELVALRNQNSIQETRYYGANADKHQKIVPLYDVVKLDQAVTRLAREIRILDEAVKETNATAKVKAYTRDEAVLGELEAAPPSPATA